MPCSFRAGLLAGRYTDGRMTSLSRRALACAPSPTLAITARANQLKAEGHDILAFGAGEPDFDTPDHIKQAAIDALAKGKTKYTPSAGIPELKNAIIEKLKRENGLEYKPGEVIVSVGGKHSLYNIFQAIIDEGDEVIIPAPYWVSYPEQVKLAQGTPVIIETDDVNGFAPTPEQLAWAVTPKTKAIVLNSPSNPTGAMWPRATIEVAAKLCVEKNLWLISDEIYEHLVYDNNEFLSPASLSPEVKARTLTVNGMSKAYSMTGWRLGYVAGDAAVIGAMNRIQDQSTSNPTSIAQWAGVAALNGPQEFLSDWVAEFDTRRKAITAGLDAIDGITCRMPEGAFYVFPNISGLIGKTTPDGKKIQDGDDFSAYLLESALVAVVPGSGFGAPEYVRLSYATSLSVIEKGLARIAEAVAALK